MVCGIMVVCFPVSATLEVFKVGVCVGVWVCAAAMVELVCVWCCGSGAGVVCGV